VLTDNGVQFCDMPSRRSGPTARYPLHKFDRICREHGIEHRLTKPNHPWTNGQVERMNRTLKDATVRRYHYDSHRQLRDHLAAFLEAYFRQALKTPRSHALRTHLQCVGRRAGSLPIRSNPPHFGTEHLVPTREGESPSKLAQEWASGGSFVKVFLE
jgi:transposase InsO family protein